MYKRKWIEKKEILRIRRYKNGKREYEKVDSSKLSDVDEIISIAMGQFSGGQLKDWQIERDNGQLIWKVEIYYNGHSMEVIIDVNTKGILKIDD